MQTVSVAPVDRGEVGGAKVVAAALGVCVGISGLDHGLFEALQGNVPTPGIFVHAIGPEQQLWAYGTEDAFTIVPNFLVAGILSMVVGALTIIWSLRFIDRPRGSRVLLGLGFLLFLVGGGVAMLVFLVIAWAMARHLRRPFRWMRFVPPRLERVLAGTWPALVAVGLALYAFTLEVAIVGFVPAVSDPDHILAICWVALVVMLLTFIAAFVGASAPSGDVAIERPHGGASRVHAG